MAAAPQAFSDALAQLLQFDGFGNQSIRGLQCGAGYVLTREENDSCLRTSASQILEDCGPGLIRHRAVQEDQIGLSSLGFLESLLGAARRVEEYKFSLTRQSPAASPDWPDDENDSRGLSGKLSVERPARTDHRQRIDKRPLPSSELAQRNQGLLRRTALVKFTPLRRFRARHAIVRLDELGKAAFGIYVENSGILRCDKIRSNAW